MNTFPHERLLEICKDNNWEWEKVYEVVHKEFGWTEPQAYWATDQIWRSGHNPSYENYN